MAAAAAAASGKGIFFAYSKIVKPEVLNEETFLKWYDEDHIPEVVASGGIRSAVRSVDLRHRDPEGSSSGSGAACERPYLSLYPLDDLSFVLSEKMAAISVTSPLLPTDGTIYTMADFDVRWYNLVDIYVPANKGKDQAKFLMLTESDNDFDESSREKNEKLLLDTPGFLRSLRLRHVGGFWSHGGGKQQLPCQRWLQICEFEGDAPPNVDAILSGGGAADEGEEAKGNNSTAQRPMVFRIENRDGEDERLRGDFFHGMGTQHDITPRGGMNGEEGDQSVSWKNSSTSVAAT